MGDVELALVRSKEKLFAKHCVSCHIIVPHGEQETKIDVTMTPVHQIKTDKKMASNACDRMVETAQLAGVRMPPFIGAKLPKKTKAAAFLAHVVTGSLLSLASKRVTANFESSTKKAGSKKVFNKIKGAV